MSFLLPLILGLGHGVSDAAAGLLVGLIFQQGSNTMNSQILFYNLVAFGLQPIAGLFIDQINRPKQGAAIGLFITLIGLSLTPVNLTFAILLIGIGSACLHAGGGSVAISATPGKASAAGVFAGFGVIGLALGGMASLKYADGARLILLLLLAILAAMILILPQVSIKPFQKSNSQTSPAYLLIILLVIAIALRSTVWVGTQIRIDRYSSAALWLAISAGTGKLVGGFGADRFGWKRWALVMLVGSGLMLFVGGTWLPALMLGALMLQSLTPLSVAALGRALPQSPALAASLTLGTAIIAGGLPFFFLDSKWMGAWTLGVTLLLSMLGYWVVLKKQSLEVSTHG